MKTAFQILTLLLTLTAVFAVEDTALAKAKLLLSTYDQKYNPYEELTVGGIPPTYELKDNDKRLNYIAALVIKDYYETNLKIGQHTAKTEVIDIPYTVREEEGKTKIIIKLGWDPYLIATIAVGSIAWEFYRNDGSDGDPHSINLLGNVSPNQAVKPSP